MNDNLELYIIDLDGTIYVDNKLIDGALNFVENLKQAKKKFCFFTNNDSKASTEFIKKLKNMNIDINKDNFYTSGLATIDYINSHYKNERVYLMGTESLKNEFVNHGINLVESDPQIVVVSFDTELTYEKLDKVCHYVRCGVKYIATHPDYNCPTSYGFAPDTGSFIKLIEASTRRFPDVVLGKPNKALGEVLCARFNVFPRNVAMVGDRLMTDMEFANKCGFKSYLVLSGETTLKAYKDSKIKVTYLVNSVKDIIIE